MHDSETSSSPTLPSGDAVPPLADQIVEFGRVLRRAGLDVGSSQMMDALRAVETVGVERRADVYQALFSVFVQKPADVELFEQAFHLFWKAPSELNELLELAEPSTGGLQPESPKRRVVEAMREPADEPPQIRPDDEDEHDVRVTATYSEKERLQKKDFADFTAEEIVEAKEAIRQMRWPIKPQRVRRRSPRRPGRVLDMRRTLRHSLRHHGEWVDLRFQGRKTKPRPIVLLCDISGSMEDYSRMLLHFMHAITGGMRKVESFVFGTRLTRITHYLRQRDVDDALDDVSAIVEDWAGGTRIGEALKEFNYTWLRRVLRSGGVVLVISDGCDRGDTEQLAHELERLSRNCHRLLWLNPLLRYEDYEPRTQGMQAALPYVDDLLPVHNLESLEQLGQALSEMNKAIAR